MDPLRLVLERVRRPMPLSGSLCCSLEAHRVGAVRWGSASRPGPAGPTPPSRAQKPDCALPPRSLAFPVCTSERARAMGTLTRTQPRLVRVAPPVGWSTASTDARAPGLQGELSRALSQTGAQELSRSAAVRAGSANRGPGSSRCGERPAGGSGRSEATRGHLDAARPPAGTWTPTSLSCKQLSSSGHRRNSGPPLSA